LGVREGKRGQQQNESCLEDQIDACTHDTKAEDRSRPLAID
jgi:hypothetical protein